MQLICNNIGVGSEIFLSREGKLFSSGGKLNGVGKTGICSWAKKELLLVWKINSGDKKSLHKNGVEITLKCFSSNT